MESGTVLVLIAGTWLLSTDGSSSVLHFFYRINMIIAGIYPLIISCA